MNNRRFVLICFISMCSVLFLLLLHEDTCTELIFSKESGFYDDPFALEIYSPVGTKIYYTLDGSEPDKNSILYTNPIIIDDATMHENVYGMRTDVSAGFLRTETNDYKVISNFTYQLPDYFIDKCTIVRASYLDPDGNFSPIKSAAYFVDYTGKSGYNEMNIISIITDPDNLFDYDTGIYVFGRSYDASEQTHPVNRLYDSNYCMRGIDWERSAAIQLFDADRNLILDQVCGLRIQGGTSRHKLPKSFNLYAREEYSNSGRFYADLFHTNYMADTVTLFAGGDDEIAKCRDMLIARLAAGRDYAVMHYEPYVMFLDGEYWGIYWLTEKYDHAYLNYYYNVDSDNVILIKANSLAEGKQSDYVTYHEMTDYMTNTDLSSHENYNYACELIDMQSFIDYYATEIYIGQRDWPGNNEALWRVREIKDDKYSDGKWRWMLYDVNGFTILSKDYATEDTLAITLENSDMFHHLCQNEDFKKQFTITFMDLANSAFSKEKVTPAISEYINQMKEPAGVHLKRFFAFEDDNTFMTEMESVQTFFDNRKSYITQYLKDDLGLTGTLAPVTVEINDASAGSIVVNTIHLTFDETCRWQGEYYTDYPISLTAVANDGYRFVRWESTALSHADSKNNCIEISFNAGGTLLKAVFEKLPN